MPEEIEEGGARGDVLQVRVASAPSAAPRAAPSRMLAPRRTGAHGSLALADVEDEERGADEADGVERERGRGLRGSRSAIPARPGPPSLRGGAADLELRVAVDELLALDERRQVRLVRDVEEDGRDADEEADAVQLPDRQVRRAQYAIGTRASRTARARSPAIRIGRRGRRSTQTPAGRLTSRKGRNSTVVAQRPRTRCVQDVDRGERQRQLGELRPELADGLGRPELDEVRMAPEATGRPELHASSGAGARSRRTVTETVFA